MMSCTCVRLNNRYSELIGSRHKYQMQYYNMKLVFWTAILTLMVVYPNTAHAQCSKINDCRCKLPNGKIIDISAIGNKDGNQPKFDYAVPDDGSSVYWEYSFNGCYSYADEYCSNAVACQRSANDPGQTGFSLGTPDTADYTDGTALTFSATGQDGQLRKTTVNLICDTTGTADSSSIRRLGEPNNDWTFVYELTSKCVCGNGCVSGSGGLSVGSILCIVFTLCVVLYLVLGIVFMKFVRGAQGKEVIPNVQIWSDFPFLIKDGFLFLVHGCKSSGYDTKI